MTQGEEEEWLWKASCVQWSHEQRTDCSILQLKKIGFEKLGNLQIRSKTLLCVHYIGVGAGGDQ